MARNKEVLVLLIDVGPSMHRILPELQKVCSMLVEKKLIFNKYDEVGVVLFGTEDTNNELTEEVGGYEHVSVFQNVKVVDGDLIDVLKKLPPGTEAGDYLDAIIVGMDLLIKKYGETEKGKKRLLLITDASCPIKDPYEGTKEDQVMTIAAQLTKSGMKMESVLIRGMLNSDAKRRIMDENDHLLKIFSSKTNAKLVYVESPTSLLGAIRTRNISTVTTFRGDFEISSGMKIKVWVYKKTSEEKFPTLKKYSDKAPSTDKFATREVKVDYEFRSSDDSNTIVPPEHRIKGYPYGPQVVPISSANWDAVKFKPEKSVKLLGFTNASNIMRHCYMKDVNVFIAEPGNRRAIVAVSALARAMKETSKVGIVRCVWRQGQGSVVVGILTPNISERENIPDSLYFNVLPFAEDVREFQFPSFSSFPETWQPNEEQQEAADNLVMMLDLAPSGKVEALQPDFTPNPILERFYRYLELKSKKPDSPVPQLDGTLKMITEPDTDLFSQNKSVLDVLRRRFDLKENRKLKKPRRSLLAEKPSGSSEREENDAIAGQIDDSTENTSEVEHKEPMRRLLLGKTSGSSETRHNDASAGWIGDKSAVKVEKIGDSNPLGDFEAMMKRRDSPEWVGKAFKEMRNKVFNLVEDSCDGDNYPKALECLLALRNGCILEQEPKEFNDFLFYLCKFCRDNNLESFPEFLAAKEVALICKSEAIDSDVPDSESKSFLVKEEP